MRSIKLCTVIAALCCMLPAVAQKQFGSAKYTHMCSYFGEDISGDIVAFEADGAAQKVVKKIMSVIGLKANFELRAANVPNAAAVMLQGKRFILYNPDYMNKINGATGSNWAAISIFAHEIGHHLNGHTLDNVGSRPQTELDADEFSGFVLQKMGAPLKDAQAVMALISSIKGSHTHPPKKDRLAFIATGWNNAAPAKGVAATVTESTAVKAPPTQVVAESKAAIAYTAPKQKTVSPATVSPEQKATARPITASTTSRTKKIQQSIQSGNVVSEAHFNADPNNKYYLTNKGNLIQVENDKVYLVASLYKSDKRGYNMMLSDHDSYKVYVANGGYLVNSNGVRVGYFRNR
ncbi:hypothetical protein GR160_14495 [Flavobacterium sp. Sd200]|uniref:hypothetical protein n=1 Tax=Flavobacterium sp. Sd200 TaxID=2692211 RepID=UPI001369E2BA|nr:hypothetical protein [Flavobacterium sp. Sd200]MXN92435.1 hypothetical protein [Flavobacterium sp. Sd200]